MNTWGLSHSGLPGTDGVEGPTPSRGCMVRDRWRGQRGALEESCLTGPRRPDFATTAFGGPRNPGGNLVDQAHLTVRPAKMTRRAESGRPDLNRGPLRPERSALPD